MKKFTYITLLGTDDYLLGTLCLSLCLKNVKSEFPLLVLVSKNVSESSIKILREYGLAFKILDRQCASHDLCFHDSRYERWKYTLDKLFVFSLIEYDKIIFIDSDIQVCQNIDHLFESPHLSAVNSDIYDNSCDNDLNSGLMVIEPSLSLYASLLSIFNNDFNNTQNFGDQDIIRKYFSNWKNEHKLHLHNKYNLYYTNVNKIKNSWGG